jgi:GTPase-activating protein SST2
LAALARDKTSAIATSLAEPALRPRPSSTSLYRASLRSPTSPTLEKESLQLPRAASAASIASTSRAGTPAVETLRPGLLETDPPSHAYEHTAADTAPTTTPAAASLSKMHQTSSRLLRMTSDDRPFTRVSEPGAASPQI